MTYAEYKAASNNTVASISQDVGPTAVALYAHGGQGVLPDVFRVIKMPKEAFIRHTKDGSPSNSLRAYAARKGIEAGFSHRRSFDAIPVTWIGHNQVFVFE